MFRYAYSTAEATTLVLVAVSILAPCSVVAQTKDDVNKCSKHVVEALIQAHATVSECEWFLYNCELDKQSGAWVLNDLACSDFGETSLYIIQSKKKTSLIVDVAMKEKCKDIAPDKQTKLHYAVKQAITAALSPKGFCIIDQYTANPYNDHKTDGLETLRLIGDLYEAIFGQPIGKNEPTSHWELVWSIGDFCFDKKYVGEAGASDIVAKCETKKRARIEYDGKSTTAEELAKCHVKRFKDQDLQISKYYATQLICSAGVKDGIFKQSFELRDKMHASAAKLKLVRKADSISSDFYKS